MDTLPANSPPHSRRVQQHHCSIQGIATCHTVSALPHSAAAERIMPPSAEVSSTSVTSARHDSVSVERQARVSAVQREYNLPSLAMGCVRVVPSDSSVCCEVYVSGVRKVGEAATTVTTAVHSNDRFTIASCTKSMTATVLAILVERGLLTWDITLPVALNSLAAVMHPSYSTVTLTMLCCHMSGLPAEAGKGRQVEDEELSAATVATARKLAAARLLSAPPLYSPGSRFVYSNAGYIVLGAVMEECTGSSWEELIVNELFRPLGITNYGFGCQADLQQRDTPNQPWPHVWCEGGIPVPVDPNSDAGAMPLWRGPCGSVNCSMDEWAKYAKLHIDGFCGRLTPVLTPASFSILHCVAGEHNYTYGGWYRKNHRLGYDTLFHSGCNRRGVATIWLAPTKCIAYMAVSNVGSKGGALNAIRELLSGMLKLDRRAVRQRSAAAARIASSAGVESASNEGGQSTQ